MISYSNLWSIQEPILAMAAIMESWLHFSGTIRDWREANAEWWFKLKTIKWVKANDVSQKFYDLFCAVYGEKILSVKRLVTSFFSSYLVLYVSYYLTVALKQYIYGSKIIAVKVTGLDFFSSMFFLEGEFMPIYSLKYALFIGFDAIGTNLLPDFISLAQTGLILKFYSRKQSQSYICWLILLDLLLTTAIWIITHGIAHWIITATTHGVYGNFWERYNILDKELSLNWLCYALTTYSTSFFWWSFLGGVFVISFLKRISKLAVLILESKIVTELPIVLIVGIPCLLCWPVLFITRLVIL